MRRNFVTLCDHRYLPRALALHDSLVEHCTAFRLWVVALTDTCYGELRRRALAGVVPVRLAEVEATLPGLVVARVNRSLVEYYYTLPPAICRYVLSSVDEGDVLTYLDADMFFFASPDRAFDLLGDASVGITPHRHSFWVRHARRGGDFNVGWVSYRNDDRGRACLEWWYDRCVEWCYQRYEDGKYADQGYLNAFSTLFKGVRILDDPGINLGPWNMARHQVRQRAAQVFVDGVPLVCFHFADLKQLTPWLYSTNTAAALVWLSPTIRRALFYPYIATLRRVASGRLPASLRLVTARDVLTTGGLRIIVKAFRNMVMMEYVLVYGEHYF